MQDVADRISAVAHAFDPQAVGVEHLVGTERHHVPAIAPDELDEITAMCHAPIPNGALGP